MPHDDDMPPMSDADLEKMVRAQEEPTMRDLARLYKPAHLRRILDHRLIGQDAQKDTISAWIYAHFQGYRPAPLLVTGQTASGKTECFRAIQDRFTDLVHIWDASMLTAEGWSGGTKLTTLIKDVAPGSIIVLDEFDKLIRPAIGAAGTNYSEIVQAELLRLFDRDVLKLGEKGKVITVDAGEISVAMTGAFAYVSDDAPEKHIGFGAPLCPRGRAQAAAVREVTVADMIRAGMMPELAGRIGTVVRLENPTEKTYTEIGEKEIRRLSRVINKPVDMDKAALRALALSAQASGLGARFLKNKLQEMVYRMVYDDPDAESICINEKKTPP